MIQAVIFDCFGVLAVDGWGPFKQRYLIDKPDALREVAAIGRLVDAGVCSVDIMITAIARHVRMSEQAVREAINRREPHEVLFDYIATELKPHYKIGLLSNASYDIRTQLFTPAQNALFDASVLSYDVGKTKADPTMYQMMLDALDVAADAAIMVDDQERYCAVARSVGLHAVHFKNIDQLEKTLKNMIQ